jgi:hypothetical protein
MAAAFSREKGFNAKRTNRGWKAAPTGNITYFFWIPDSIIILPATPP